MLNKLLVLFSSQELLPVIMWGHFAKQGSCKRAHVWCVARARATMKKGRTRNQITAFTLYLINPPPHCHLRTLAPSRRSRGNEGGSALGFVAREMVGLAHSTRYQRFRGPSFCRDTLGKIRKFMMCRLTGGSHLDEWMEWRSLPTLFIKISYSFIVHCAIKNYYKFF